MVRYSVGRWDRSAPRDRWIPFGYFSSGLEAMRTARRLHAKKMRAWLQGQGEYPQVDAIVCGEGTVYNLDFYYSLLCGQLSYWRLLEQIGWLNEREAESRQNA